jgi:DNA-3-methyladenine glycosylase I
MPEKFRCPWSVSNPMMIRYHDEEWGVPVRDDHTLFEYLVLDAFQAGLSWNTILNRREGFHRAFAGFDVVKVSQFTDEDYERLLHDEGIIRNRLKISSSITNAKAFIELQKEFGSFSKYIWQFTGDKTIQNNWNDLKQVPARTPESDAMSKDMKKRGFKFVGSTICYAFMQAAGMVNDHLTTCFRHSEVQ